MPNTNIIIMIASIVIVAVGVLMMTKGKKPKAAKAPEVEPIIVAVGGLKNITNVTASMSKIKFELNDVTDVNFEELKLLGSTGVIKSSTSITVIFGSVSKQIADEINKRRA